MEHALWSAIRALEEKQALLRKVAELDRAAGDAGHAERAERDAGRLAAQVTALRRLIERG